MKKLLRNNPPETYKDELQELDEMLDKAKLFAACVFMGILILISAFIIGLK